MRINLRQAWNQISRAYQAHNRIPTDFVHYGPHCPNEDQLQVIGDVRGKHVLEIGCGGGGAGHPGAGGQRSGTEDSVRVAKALRHALADILSPRQKPTVWRCTGCSGRISPVTES